jgi:streptogramin lyase
VTRAPVLEVCRLMVAIFLANAVASCSSNAAPSALADDVPLQSGQQTTLFDAMDYSGMAVDGGNVLYLGGLFGVATVGPGADTPTPLKGGPPVMTFAVAPDGTLYFVSPDHVVETVKPPATRPEALPFGNLHYWGQIAVGTDGAVYLADNENNRLLTLEPGAAEPTALPVEGLDDIGHMVIDADDNLYAYMNKRLVKIPKGATSVEPIDGAPENIGGLAVDAAGNLYASDNKAGTVSRRPASGGDWVQLPLHDIQNTTDIAVDRDGNLYVIATKKSEGFQVVKLAPR